MYLRKYQRSKDGKELPLFLDAEETPPSSAPDIVRIRLDRVGWTNARAFGDVWLGWQLWRKHNLDKIVARHIKTGRETVSPATIVAIEVISRFVHVEVKRDQAGQSTAVSWNYRKDKLRTALARDGAYLLLSDKTDWSAEDLWRTWWAMPRSRRESARRIRTTPRADRRIVR